MNIGKYNKLHSLYYKALKKAVFKPSAFFKGILLPLSKDATSKEAAIVGSILMKVSVPVLHASAAILKMCTYNFTLGTSYFIKCLLGKKYSLPTRVLEGLVDYFCKFKDSDELMPVLWHQTLLIFAQRYHGN
jgi:essential nuclear protein 1